MRHRAFILPTFLLVLMVGGAFAVYAYGAARDDLIADGVTADGIELGGMRASEARQALDERLAAPLSRPLKVRSSQGRFHLSARRAGLKADVEGMVQEALERSREGNVVSRVIRDLKGNRVSASIEARVTYDRAAVTALVGRIAKRMERPSKDASVDYSGTGLRSVAGHNGRTLRARELKREILAEIVRPEADRVVRARTKVTRPAVTLDNLAEKYPYFLTVSRSSKELRFFKALKLAKKYRVAIGRAGFETPTGLYHIQNKGENVAWNVPEWGGKLAGKTIPGGDPRNPLKARWLGFFDGAGIHGTTDIASLGSAASHGCIRMAIPQVKELYGQVPVQTPIFIS